MFNLKQLFRELVQWVKSPDAPHGALIIVRQREIVTRIGDTHTMHVDLTIGIPLITSHEKAQLVKTRNFMAVKNGDTVNPLLALVGQDPASLTSVTLTPLQYGDKITLQLFDVDQAGNISAPLDGEIVLVDTIPPDAPVGSFTMNMTEVADPGDGEDAPVVAEPVATPVADTPATADAGSGNAPSSPANSSGDAGSPANSSGDAGSPPSG